MPKSIIKSQGSFINIFKSWTSLLKIVFDVKIRRATNKPIVAAWSEEIEIGNLFWREQFTRALAMDDIQKGREYFDSLQIYYQDDFETKHQVISGESFKGEWITPTQIKDDAILLYLHGGGYSFYAAVTKYFAKMLSCILKRKLFALDYRLTPENKHPAQQEDAIAAYQYLLKNGHDPNKIVLIGDSAGGHLVLMTLLAIKKLGLPQPAAAIGLCPWTDIGNRGESLLSNNIYDLVQGNMALQFGEWLIDKKTQTREELSPIFHDFSGTAPIYLQGGEYEVLIDMIREFANVLKSQKCDITFDVFEKMTHNFHGNGTHIKESKEAFKRIDMFIEKHVL